ncbi:TonB-dependent receptor [Litorivivens sp.]|uniref:TonB-dependent receptor n=1 Tax=Litorivivens sp. TaxID=2020868 RepID=UPI0035673858
MQILRVAIVPALVMCQLTFAQQQAPASAEVQGRVIEEVIVSANKTEQSVQDIAGSVQALTGDMMQKANLTDFTEISKYIPNTQLTDDGLEPTIAVRGVRSVAAIGGGDNSVGLVIDDLALSRQTYFHAGFFDLERIEVLRGPQGTLFGKSTTAGVLNLVSNAPTDEFSGYITLRKGEHDEQAQLAVSGPLTDNIRARIGVLYDRPGSQQTNTFNGDDVGFIDRSAARVKLAWDISDTNELTLFWTTAEVDHMYLNQKFDFVNDQTRDFIDDYDPQFDTDMFNDKISFDFEPQTWIDHMQSFGARLESDWGSPLAFDALSTTLILGGTDMAVNAHGDVDYSPADIIRIPVAIETVRMSQLEARVNGTLPGFFALGRGSTEFITGIFAQKEQVHYDYRIVGGDDTIAWLLGPGAQAAGGPATGGFGPGILNCPTCVIPASGSLAGDGVKILPAMDTKALGVFAHMVYRPIEPLSITLGLRWDRNKRDANMPVIKLHPSGEGDLSVLAPLLGAEEDVVLTPKIRERKVSPKISLQYELFGGDVVTYMTWQEGYKGGAFNFFALNESSTQQVEPEQVESYEVGIKSVLMDRSLSMNLSVYDSEFTDLHVYVTTGDSVLPLQQLANAAKARTQGAEFDAMFMPGFAPWLTLSGAVAYNDAYYEEYPNGPDGTDFAGKTLAAAPLWSGVLTTELRFPLPLLEDSGAISWAVDATYSSEYWTDADLAPELIIDEALIYHTRLSVTPASEAWSLTLAINNVTDEKTYSIRSDTGGVWPDAIVGRAAPRRQASLDFSWFW